MFRFLLIAMSSLIRFLFGVVKYKTWLVFPNGDQVGVRLKDGIPHHIRVYGKTYEVVGVTDEVMDDTLVHRWINLKIDE